MSEVYLRAGDVISGQEGAAQAIIDGRVETLFMLKTLEATVRKEKEEIRALGRRGAQHKAVGWSGTGRLRAYYVSSRFRQLMIDYAQTGVDAYFDIIVTNSDPTSSIGRQTVALRNCNLDAVTAVKLDAEAAALDEEMEFTFDDVDLIEAFAVPGHV